MKLSFIIPILNEQDSLSELYDEILQNCVSYDYEIIFIDDGSSDNSFGVMQQMAAKDEKVKVIKFRRNFGKAAALQLGFTIASGEIVFTLDGDLQDNPIEIPHFIEKLNEGYDLVSGWKRKRHDPLYKTLPSKLFNFVTAKTFRLKLKDYNCGFKAYRHPLEKELTLYGEMHRYIPVLAHS
ncbi:MAG: glycosyltransferase family 2 protein, partial [Candidatus Cloacimonas sp.]|nr:glycosyltransferase family 2 protein [Candidatus Cloacimonas sp.]